jgi:hypothetical protein
MSVKIIPISKAYRENWPKIFSVKNTTNVVKDTPDASGVNRDAGGSRADVTGSSAISGVFANYGGKAMPFQYPAYLIVDGEVHW